MSGSSYKILSRQVLLPNTPYISIFFFLSKSFLSTVRAGSTLQEKIIVSQRKLCLISSSAQAAIVPQVPSKHMKIYIEKMITSLPVLLLVVCRQKFGGKINSKVLVYSTTLHVLIFTEYCCT